MKILTYSPSIEAYAAVTGNGDVAYYDLSSDITRATISRKSDTASSFTLHLLNKNGKYNDVFSPMDRVKIYLTKSKRHAVLSGYIKSAPKFNLYRSELSITGYDTIYRLQELFWDPQLIASQQQLGYSTTIGWEGVIMNLLANVAGYDPTTVKIGSIPSEVIDWAHELYAAKQTDIEQARNMVNEFYEVLRTSGPKFATGGASSSGALPISPAPRRPRRSGTSAYRRGSRRRPLRRPSGTPCRRVRATLPACRAAEAQVAAYSSGR